MHTRTEQASALVEPGPVVVRPAAQGVQVGVGADALPPPLKLPVAHGMHPIPPWPRAQTAMHAALEVDPMTAVPVPAPQGVQPPVPPAENVPGRQTVHTPEAFFPKPGRHSWQASLLVAPGCAVVVDSPQNAQLGVGLAVVPPGEYQPMLHWEQDGPPKPGAHTATPHAEADVGPESAVVAFKNVVRPAGQGVQLTPARRAGLLPALQLPRPQTAHGLAPTAPLPGEHTLHPAAAAVPVVLVLEPDGHARHEGVELLAVVVPPADQKPTPQATQLALLPLRAPNPGAQTLQSSTAAWSVYGVLHPTGHARQGGCGSAGVPPGENCPRGHEEQEGPPRPAWQMGTVQLAALEAPAAAVDRPSGHGWQLLCAAEGLLSALNEPREHGVHPWPPVPARHTSGTE